ncbi:unnamed protein product [Amoebophrya sp. A120]|nr:unnamed protein product [Amoebophrya sp. A120]|eukprot:GSA120T00002618001.1
MGNGPSGPSGTIFETEYGLPAPADVCARALASPDFWRRIRDYMDLHAGGREHVSDPKWDWARRVTWDGNEIPECELSQEVELDREWFVLIDRREKVGYCGAVLIRGKTTRHVMFPNQFWVELTVHTSTCHDSGMFLPMNFAKGPHARMWTVNLWLEPYELQDSSGAAVSTGVESSRRFPAPESSRRFTASPRITIRFATGTQ